MAQIPATTLRDHLGSVPLVDTATATTAIADTLQRIPNPGVRLGAILCASLLATEASGLPLADCFGTARNIMNHAEGKRPEFLAVSDYYKNEVFTHA